MKLRWNVCSGCKALPVDPIFQCPRSGTKYTHLDGCRLAQSERRESFDQLNPLLSPARTMRHLSEGIVGHNFCRVTVSARAIEAELLPRSSVADDNQDSEATKREPRQHLLRASDLHEPTHLSFPRVPPATLLHALNSRSNDPCNLARVVAIEHKLLSADKV
ncbi:hypothetical protein HDV57DRAFT_178276 [Trichoderma longibrachiatum]|uniref:Uncharacterized protein n=1 Tax=Trichoderma longibrachiatum ATCC 18648 TaxID=983965 RepID=A0A2T4CAP2_TRILO|nr:hypothetical protein M440DRAFT_1198315 [Trichoderma longibrachiatum ATCC 18648]